MSTFMFVLVQELKSHVARDDALYSLLSGALDKGDAKVLENRIQVLELNWSVSALK